jgi:hypothetical protein
MNDAQFQELLKHIDRVPKDIGFAVIVAAILVFIGITVHGLTRG